jgi:hypothetical protein
MVDGYFRFGMDFLWSFLAWFKCLILRKRRTHLAAKAVLKWIRMHPLTLGPSLGGYFVVLLF